MGLDFNAHFAQNLPVWIPPFNRKQALYAVDDLHRLEVVLRSMLPRPRGSYVKAKRETAFELEKLKDDRFGIHGLTDEFEQSRADRVAARADEILQRAGVYVADDLSFN